MGRLVIIIGQLASGKTTLADYMVEHKGFKRIKTVTTRPMRPGEDDSSYTFVTKEEFKELLDEDMLAEFTSFTVAGGDTWYYGSPKSEYETDKDVVVVLNPQGMLMIANQYEHAEVIYLKADLELLIKRGLDRGDNPVELCRRLITDTPLFEEVEAVGMYSTMYFVEGESAQHIYDTVVDQEAVDRMVGALDPDLGLPQMVPESVLNGGDAE